MGIAVPAPVAQPQAQPSSSPAATAELRAWFAAVDTARTGRINCDQLRAALSSSGFDFRAGTAERLVRMFDRDRSSTIEFDEFIKAHGFIRDLAAGFRARDTDGSGVLEGPEVREALAISGFRLTEPTFQITMRKFDHQKRGGLRFDDYIDLSITIGTARNVFAFYDRNKSDLVTFDFNAFFAAQLAAYV